MRGLTEFPLDGEVAIRAAGLSDIGADPADRFIVATALAGHLLVTADRRILSWPGSLSRMGRHQMTPGNQLDRRHPFT